MIFAGKKSRNLIIDACILEQMEHLIKRQEDPGFNELKNYIRSEMKSKKYYSITFSKLHREFKDNEEVITFLEIIKSTSKNDIAKYYYNKAINFCPEEYKYASKIAPKFYEKFKKSRETLKLSENYSNKIFHLSDKSKSLILSGLAGIGLLYGFAKLSENDATIAPTPSPVPIEENTHVPSPTINNAITEYDRIMQKYEDLFSKLDINNASYQSNLNNILHNLCVDVYNNKNKTDYDVNDIELVYNLRKTLDDSPIVGDSNAKFVSAMYILSQDTDSNYPSDNYYVNITGASSSNNPETDILKDLYDQGVFTTHNDAQANPTSDTLEAFHDSVVKSLERANFPRYVVNYNYDTNDVTIPSDTDENIVTNPDIDEQLTR